MTFRVKPRINRGEKAFFTYLAPAIAMVLAVSQTTISTPAFAFQSKSEPEIAGAENSIFEVPALEAPELEGPELEGPGQFEDSLGATPPLLLGDELETKSVVQPPMTDSELEAAPEENAFGEVDSTFSSSETPEFNDLYAEEPLPLPPKTGATEQFPLPQTDQAILGVYGAMTKGWGFKIYAVVAGSAADKMKLEPGDVILSINGVKVDSVRIIHQQVGISALENQGVGFVQIDNVRGRTQKRLQRSCSVRVNLRYQTIRFRL